MSEPLTPRPAPSHGEAEWRLCAQCGCLRPAAALGATTCLDQAWCDRQRRSVPSDSGRRIA